MCPYPWQVQREDQTSVLACPPYGKACQSNSGVHPFPGVFRFRILLWCLPQEVALGCQPGRVTSWPQGAAPRGTGTSRAVHDPWPCLQHSERALTCSKRRGCPAHCPPLAGPVGKEPGAEAWYVSGGHHQFSSHHRKSLQWLSRGCWHLWAQNLPEHCLWQRCWGLLDPRRGCGSGTWYQFTSFLSALNPFSGQLTYWYRVRTSLSYDPSLVRKQIRVQVTTVLQICLHSMALIQ